MSRVGVWLRLSLAGAFFLVLGLLTVAWGGLAIGLLIGILGAALFVVGIVLGRR